MASFIFYVGAWANSGPNLKVKVMTQFTIEMNKTVHVAMKLVNGDTKTFPVDVTEMSDAAIAHCLSNGIQRFCNDAANNIASGEDESKKDEVKSTTIEAKIAKLTADHFEVGARGSSVDVWTREARNYLSELANVKQAIKGKSAADKYAILDKLIEGNQDKIKDAVDQRVKVLTAKPTIELKL